MPIIVTKFLVGFFSVSVTLLCQYYYEKIMYDYFSKQVKLETQNGDLKCVLTNSKQSVVIFNKVSSELVFSNELAINTL